MTFTSVFNRLLGNEGGYTSGHGDPGGETNWGISKRSYPSVDIKNLTREGAQAIYSRDFWLPLHADTLPGSVAFQLFDFAVNSGIRTAIRALQRTVGVVDDGFWGPQSQQAAGFMSETDMIMRLLAERLDFMTTLANWPTAGRGWARRIAANLRFGAIDA